MCRKRGWEVSAGVALILVLVWLGTHFAAWRMRQQDLDRQLGLALERREAAAVGKLIRDGADVRTRGRDGYTPLVHAVWQNDRGLVREILKRGAPVDAQEADGVTPLMYAAWLGRREIARELIAAGADVNAQDHRRNTPLFLAKDRGMVQALKQAGAMR